jgi:hypothetical protein
MGRNSEKAADYGPDGGLRLPGAMPKPLPPGCCLVTFGGVWWVPCWLEPLMATTLISPAAVTTTAPPASQRKGASVRDTRRWRQVFDAAGALTPALSSREPRGRWHKPHHWAPVSMRAPHSGQRSTLIDDDSTTDKSAGVPLVVRLYGAPAAMK